jgi:hypothetical protein
VLNKLFDLFDYPTVIFVISLLAFWGLAWIGVMFWGRYRELRDAIHDDFTFILGAALTLLGLIIGFTFSMAVSRYDQRKNYEEQEANAIGTEYLRANLLPAGDAAKVRGLLRNYLDQRLLSYNSRNDVELKQIDAQTTRLQNEMWSAVATPAEAQPTPIAALVVSGMNDVLNSQGYTQAAWWNRIPTAAWLLLLAICSFCNLLIGLVARAKSAFLFLILPVALAICLSLIADIDGPRRGFIHVRPQNLESLAESMRSQ